MKIAALQMVSTPDVARNLDAARALIAEAAGRGAALVALPEYFCLIGRRDADKLDIAEPDGDGPIQTMLADAARTHGVWVAGGTLPMAVPGRADRVRNACCVYAPDGTRTARYDKIHLFRFSSGGESYDEGRVLDAGDTPVAFDLPAPSGTGAAPSGDDTRPLRVGLSVCYDLRFPELYRQLSSPEPCDVLLVPSAFTHTTGRAHWELLLRARAVENQCYVVAPAQGGLHENGRRTWGHSMVVDPWGEVLACVDEGEGIALAELDAARLASVRQQLPALTHRRLERRRS